MPCHVPELNILEEIIRTFSKKKNRFSFGQLGIKGGFES